MSRRPTTIFVAIVLTITLLIAYNANLHKKSWEEISQNVGMGEWASRHGVGAAPSRQTTAPQIEYRPGVPKPAGQNYTKTLVIPKIKSEDTSWMDEVLPGWDIRLYIADDPHAPLHPPRNKGHEVMIYLTYIIDNYEDLPDVSIFMHAHLLAWHNADLFGQNAGSMLTNLNPARVIREGFMNMRCQWDPGCPDWMHPGSTEEDVNRPEEVLIAKAWAELFPLEPVPALLASPCCSQFAVSRERILSIPLTRFIFYRDWLLKTPLKDFVSGRVWEYMWQYVFTGEAFFCPTEHICHCDGFGICFGGKEAYDDWWNTRIERDLWNNRWLDWEEKGKKIQEAIDDDRYDDIPKLEAPEPGKDVFYQDKVDELQDKMDRTLKDALERGRDPRKRAQECGRAWSEGDGF